MPTAPQSDTSPPHTETKIPRPTPLDQAIAATPEVNMRSIWAGEDQRYATYDGRRCVYSLKMLDNVLGGDFRNAPMGEKAAFIAVCINAGLDPLRRHIYFVKYKASEPAGFVTAWDVFLDRAGRHPMFDGFESGVVWKVEHTIERGQPCDYEQDKDHRVIGGWATVYRKDQKHARHVEIPLSEMQGKTREGEPTRFWKKMPTTMATKTPAARALRQSFPDVLAGLFIQEEIDSGHESSELESGDPVPLDQMEQDMLALGKSQEPPQAAEAATAPEPEDESPSDPGGDHGDVQPSKNPFPD